MPGFNQTGPEGSGSKTGWQRGMCRRTDNMNIPGDGSSCGRGLGRGRGLGQGQNRKQNCNLDSAVQSPQKIASDGSGELAELREQYKAAKNMLSILGEKIAALESAQSSL